VIGIGNGVPSLLDFDDQFGIGIAFESMIGGIGAVNGAPWTPAPCWHWQSPSPCMERAGVLFEFQWNNRGNNRLLSSQPQFCDDKHPDATNNKPLARASEAKRRRSMGSPLLSS
jgi:hypothetical protein